MLPLELVCICALRLGNTVLAYRSWETIYWVARRVSTAFAGAVQLSVAFLASGNNVLRASWQPLP